MTQVHEHFGCGGPHSQINTFLAGLECEIEGVTNPVNHGIFHPVPDGSLRNNGIEFLSIPSSRAALMEGFTELHSKLVFQKDVDPFSVRTSTHVHVNCSTLGLDQARIMVLLYALFEECFFMMVKPNRRDNIHCVPLTETPLPREYKKPLPNLVERWSKYTALNLKRLKDLGTMEFRHMHGTKDAVELNEWLHCLENLWNLCQRTEISAATLTKENIKAWHEAIFWPSSQVMSMRHSLFDIIRNNIIDVKFSV